MVTVTVDIPSDVNKAIEHYKIEHELKDKRDAIVMLLKNCTSIDRCSMEDVFDEVNKMKPVKLNAKDIVRLKKEAYSA